MLVNQQDRMVQQQLVKKLQQILLINQEILYSKEHSINLQERFIQHQNMY